MSALQEQTLIAGRYGIVREIGRGTTGRVYLALDRHLDREVAVKVLDQRLAADPDIVQRFDQEIRFTARLQHPGIVNVFESAHTTDGAICYVMTFARGQSLESRLNHLRSLGPDHWRELSLIDRLTLFLKLLEVVSYAHSQGIVHRDLKPANIMLGTYGEVLILDWGLARSLRDEQPRIEQTYEELFDVPTINHGTATIIMASTPVPRSATVPNVVTSQPPSTTTLRPSASIDTDTEATARISASDNGGLSSGSGRLRTIGGTVAAARESATARQTSARYRTQPATAPEVMDIDQVATGRTARPATGQHTIGDSQRLARCESRRIARSTQHGQVLGSPAYMSPEQAKGNAAAADHRTDLYSLGVILVELLTLATPCAVNDGDGLQAILKRVREGQRRTLVQLWPEAPIALQHITEWTLAQDSQERYPDCEVLGGELRTLLSQLSASYSELERQRLAKDREGAWLSVGLWDYGAAGDAAPFAPDPQAINAEQVGHVHHPELGGMLLGGYGLQLYPLALRLGDDVRVSLTIDIVKGSEFWLFLRGVPPTQAYQFRFGAYGGKWLTIGRGAGTDGTLNPDFLTMRPLRDHSSNAHARGARTRHRLVIEAVGAMLSIAVDEQSPLTVRDVHALSGLGGAHLALATWTAQVLVRQLQVERRRSPLLVPAHVIGGELLRQNLPQQAIAFYRGFVSEHPGAVEVVEARYMLFLALIQAGEVLAAEREIRDLLAHHLDHPLAQDAIFQLVSLRLRQSGIRRAVQELLSFQESGDVVRTRFCLWLMPHLGVSLGATGLTPEFESDLTLLRSLIRGSPDEKPLLQTLSSGIVSSLRRQLNRLIDADDAVGLASMREAMARLQSLGYQFPIREQHLHADYRRLAKHLIEVDDPAETVLFIGRGEDDASVLFDFVRDVLALVDAGCERQLLAAFASDDLTPVERLLRAGLRLRLGAKAEALSDIERCFRLMDVLETERTSLVLLIAARLGFYGLGYLPWDQIQDGLATIGADPHGTPLAAIAGWLAEALGNRDHATLMYQRLTEPGSGFALVGMQGLARLAAEPKRA